MTEQLTLFRVSFADHTKMTVQAASAAEARTIASGKAKERGTIITKIKVVRES